MNNPYQIRFKEKLKSALNSPWNKFNFILIIPIIFFLLYPTEIRVESFFESQDLFWLVTILIFLVYSILVLGKIIFNNRNREIDRDLVDKKSVWVNTLLLVFLGLFTIYNLQTFFLDRMIYFISFELNRLNLLGLTDIILEITLVPTNLFGILLGYSGNRQQSTRIFEFLGNDYFYEGIQLKNVNEILVTPIMIYSEICIAFVLGLFIITVYIFLRLTFFPEKVRLDVFFKIIAILFIFHVFMSILRFSIIMLVVMIQMKLGYSYLESFSFSHDLLGNFYYGLIYSFFSFKIISYIETMS